MIVRLEVTLLDTNLWEAGKIGEDPSLGIFLGPISYTSK